MNKKISKGGKGNTKFVPTMEQWWELRLQWEKKMASSLWRNGSSEDCQKVVQDAFDKVMGIHPDYKLEKDLEPMYLGQWYKTVLKQAKWIMGHHHEHDGRATGYSTTDEEEVGQFGMVEYAIDDVCRNDLRREIRGAVIRACRARGFGDNAILGFFKTKFEGKSVREAAGSVEENLTENALNQRNYKIFEWLKQEAKNPTSEIYKLWAA